MKTRIALMAMALLKAQFGFSQAIQVSHDHDAAKMNQITVMESGTGTLTPGFYYNLFHESYGKSAASKNMDLYRTTAGVNLYNQKDDAQSIDSAFVKRAAVEALNVADRSGGALDLAWKTEGDKLTYQMDGFMQNINKIRPGGGSTEEYNYWLQYYNVYASAIHSIQDAYMPNARRKREYLRIYEDVSRKNDLLFKYLLHVDNSKRVDEMLHRATLNLTTSKPDIVRAALSRWKASGMRNSTAVYEGH